MVMTLLRITQRRSIGIIRQHNKTMHQHNLILDSSMKMVGPELRTSNLQGIIIPKQQNKALQMQR